VPGFFLAGHRLGLLVVAIVAFSASTTTSLAIGDREARHVGRRRLRVPPSSMHHPAGTWRSSDGGGFVAAQPPRNVIRGLGWSPPRDV
jgi:hypothetical protein